MSEPVRNYFKFHSDALADDTLLVSRIEGYEEISKLYRFELELGSMKLDIDLDAVLKEPAWLGIKQLVRSGAALGDRTRLLQVHGMITSFELVERRETVIWYRGVLVPRLWKLSQEYQSRIFLDRSIPQILEEVLKRAGFGPDDYELRLTGRYASREFVVQYEESDLDFLQRWMEHEGIYYFFEHTMEAEKVVFADGPPAASREAIHLPYRPPAAGIAGGAEERSWEERILALACSIHTVPKEIVLKDYNWRRPTDDLRCSAEVSPNGVGTHFEYNNHFKTKEEGNALAKIRAQERKCRIRSYSGEGTCRAFRAGKELELVDHYRSDFNEKLLLTRVHHSGAQEILAGSSLASAARYRNDFGALPASEKFRPERRTPWPAIKGVMNASIDGSGTGQYAEVDAEGRYKVILPFDLSGRVEGKASRFVRMQQPYSGNGHGMHFPLHKGAEVLLTFVDGDPDRPIISGTVPNTDHPSIVNANNHTAGGIRTAGGNSIEMEDADGHQRIHMASGSGHSKLVLGSGSIDRAETASTAAGMVGALMTGQYAAISSSMCAGKNISLHSSGYLGVIIPALLSQQYPQTLASNELSGSGLKLPMSMQADSLVAVLEAVMKYGWKKMFLDWDFSAKFESLGAYLIRWKGASRFQLNGTAGDDILIGADTGDIRIQTGENVLVNAQKSFCVRNMGTAEIKSPTGQFYITADSAGLTYYHANGLMFGEAQRMTRKQAFKETVLRPFRTVVNKIAGREYWKGPPPSRIKGGSLAEVIGMSNLDPTKPMATVHLDDGGGRIQWEEGTPGKGLGRLLVKDEGEFCTSDSLLLAGGGGADTPEKGPFIDLDEDIKIDCSATKKAEVFIKAANKRTIIVNDESIVLDMGDKKTCINVWGDGNIDIFGTKTITLDAKTIAFSPKNKKIDCGGAMLVNCKGIDK